MVLKPEALFFGGWRVVGGKWSVVMEGGEWKGGKWKGGKVESGKVESGWDMRDIVLDKNK